MSQSEVLAGLLDLLWQQYKGRVAYAAQYQRMVEERGGQLRNDHIAFRTFNCDTGEQPRGVEAIARIFLALGYERKDNYLFADKYLTAWHYEHKTDPRNPKIFISQLEVDQLPPETRDAIRETVADAPDLLSEKDRTALASLSKGQSLSGAVTSELAANLAAFFSRPWNAPERSTVIFVDEESQYAAWTLLHGNSVNHFTAYINEQDVKDWPDIETTVTAMRAAGIPMKEGFEGERHSKLRQSSTKAAMEDCPVIDDDGKAGKLHWSYAYYELAERGDVPGPDGKTSRFQGFLGPQATNLFEMTKRS
ncbi:2-oxoadipate dioxygenase/decarboxylase family protein [Silvibacterium acidisoli]|uniref:2-oxoadipate dioxygenase/decarboxylase family protein n=1 Tax=Acidobacteriaceae bacterium ZG23-2 TaxID=2883246 RepID=UPI00406BEF18